MQLFVRVKQLLWSLQVVQVLHFIHKLHSCCGIRVNLCRGVQLLRRKAGRRGVNFVDRRLFDCDAQACRSRADHARAALYEQALVLAFLLAEKLAAKRKG